MLIRCTQADHFNQKIIGVCVEYNCQYQRPYCNSCLPQHCQHFNKLTALEFLDEWVNKRVLIVHNVQQKVQECKLALDSLLNKFINLFNINQVQLSTLGLSQLGNIINGLCLMESYEKTLLDQFLQSIEKIKQIVKEILENQTKQINLSSTDNLQNQKHFDTKELNIEESKHLNLMKPNLQPLTFRLMNQNSVKQAELCQAIAINKDNSIVLAGCHKYIKVFELNQGKLNQIQLLTEHQFDVCTLNFMKKSNHFVSGSKDNQIIIWQMNQNNLWNRQHQFNRPTDAVQLLLLEMSTINSLLLNNDENLIIAGSRDRSIKFWKKQNGWQLQQTIKDHTNWVYQLSLNEMQDKLISCSEDSQILVIEYSQKNQMWNVIQKIKVEQYGYRLSFINDNQFVFQPKGKEQLHVYEINSSNQQFDKTNQITVKSGSNCNNLFPQQYLKSKCLLVNKNGQNINLIRKKENGEFITEQSIQFGHPNLYGQLSDDGEYLITWDQQTKEIQIRKFKEL